MTGAAMSRGTVWQEYMARTMRVVAITGLVTCGMTAAFAFILWDSDFYATRDRWEHFKQAWFGEWKPTPWCPRGTQDDCNKNWSLAELLEKTDDASFFKSRFIAGTSIRVTTGVSFATGSDVLNGTPQEYWCYVTHIVAGGRKQIELATRTGTALPVYSSLDTIPASDFTELGLSRAALRAAAVTHCDFGNWLSAPTASSGSKEKNDAF